MVYTQYLVLISIHWDPYKVSPPSQDNKWYVSMLENYNQGETSCQNLILTLQTCGYDEGNKVLLIMLKVKEKHKKISPTVVLKHIVQTPICK